ncbi:MAG: hypothetical protein RIC95_09570 [Vicingaceae bacterium]
MSILLHASQIELVASNVMKFLSIIMAISVAYTVTSLIKWHFFISRANLKIRRKRENNKTLRVRDIFYFEHELLALILFFSIIQFWYGISQLSIVLSASFWGFTNVIFIEVLYVSFAIALFPVTIIIKKFEGNYRFYFASVIFFLYIIIFLYLVALMSIKVFILQLEPFPELGSFIFRIVAMLLAFIGIWLSPKPSHYLSFEIQKRDDVVARYDKYRIYHIAFIVAFGLVVLGFIFKTSKYDSYESVNKVKVEKYYPRKSEL